MSGVMDHSNSVYEIFICGNNQYAIKHDFAIVMYMKSKAKLFGLRILFQCTRSKKIKIYYCGCIWTFIVLLCMEPNRCHYTACHFPI